MSDRPAGALATRGVPEPLAWDRFVGASLFALGFFLPFSSAGVSISLGLLLLAVVLRPRACAADLRAAVRTPVMAMGLLLWAYIALHTLAVTGWQMATLHMANQYHELLFAPVLMALMARRTPRERFYTGLVAGAVVLGLAHWAALLDPALADRLSSRRIVAGFALAVCAFLVLLREPGPRRTPGQWALAGWFAATVLFAISGRTGYVVLLLLTALAAWQLAPRRLRLPLAVAAPLVVLAFALASDSFQTRLRETLRGEAVAPATAESPMTSTAIRAELMRLGWDLSRRYALAGAGYTSYPQVHEEAAQRRYGADPQRSWMLAQPWIRASNPHNEYVMQIVGGGIVGLSLYLAWLLLALREARRVPRPWGALITGSVLAFAVGGLFNSMLLDFVDGHFYMGVLAWLLAAARAPAGQRQPRRIAIIATRQIGDVLLTTPVIHAVRRRWPQAHIAVVGFRGTMGMLAGNADVDEQVESPHAQGWRAEFALMRRLWRRHDLALVTDGSDRAHLLGWIAAPVRSGTVPPRRRSNLWKQALLHHVVVSTGDRGSVHTAEEKLALLQPWTDRDALAAMPAEVVPPNGAPLPPAVAATVREGAVVVHAPSMWEYKQWPIARYAEVVRALLAQGRQVVLTGSGAERDQACIASLRTLGTAPRLLDVSGQLDFQQLVTLLRRCALYIGPDTSVTHLAAATGTPVVAVFGPTNPVRWGPLPAVAAATGVQGPARPYIPVLPVQRNGNVSIVQASQPCVPCGRAGCDDHRASRSECLQAITPQQVLAEAARMLARRPTPVEPVPG